MLEERAHQTKQFTEIRDIMSTQSPPISRVFEDKPIFIINNGKCLNLALGIDRLVPQELIGSAAALNFYQRMPLNDVSALI